MSSYSNTGALVYQEYQEESSKTKVAEKPRGWAGLCRHDFLSIFPKIGWAMKGYTTISGL